MEKMNFKQLKEFLQDPSCGGYFNANGKRIKKGHLPMAPAEILIRIPKKGLDLSIIKSEGGMATGPNPDSSRYDWSDFKHVVEFLGDLLKNGLVKKTRKGFYKISRAAKNADYNYSPMAGW